MDRIDEGGRWGNPFAIGVPVLRSGIPGDGGVQLGVEAAEKAAVGIDLGFPLRVQGRGNHQQLALLVLQEFRQFAQGDKAAVIQRVRFVVEQAAITLRLQRPVAVAGEHQRVPFDLVGALSLDCREAC